MTISPGESFGPYWIIEPLGQGGMATVFKGYHPALDRYVAIKVLHPALKEDPNFLTRFNREARIVAKLDHPNIVPIYDFAEQAGTPYLVMRYVEGKTLKAVLQEGMLPIPRLLAIIRPVTEALGYAHAQGVLHRDIKPSNILRANDGHIYLTDFGLARIAQATESTLSQDMLIGTPQYISPEQAQGAQATEASDIYSLGVVLFEMFTGRVPFTADTPYAIIHDHIYTPLPLPTSINPALDPAIERVLLKAMAKDPHARFANAGELMTALQNAAGMTASTVATITPPPAPIVPQPEPAKPASTAAKTPTAPPPGTATPVPAKPARKFTWGMAMVIVGLLLALVVVGSVLVINLRNLQSRGTREPTAIVQVNATIKAANDRVAANPKDANAYIQLGDEFANQKDYQSAFTEYDRAINVSPNSPGVYTHAAGLAVKVNDLDRAAKYYEAGFAATQQNYFLWMQADILASQRKLDQAQMLYEKVLRSDPMNANAHFGLGRIAVMRDDVNEAKTQFTFVIDSKNAPTAMIEDAQRQIAALPDPVQQAKARVERGDAFASQKQYSYALNEYNLAIKLDPRNPHIYAQAGKAATANGDFDRAATYFTIGRNLAPEDHDLMLAQADMFIKWNKFDDARAVLDKLIGLDPNNAQAIWRMGSVDRAQGKLTDALRNYTRAVALDPNLPEAHFGLGMLAMGRGANDEARRQFKIVINNPDAPQDIKDQATKQLATLGDK